MRGTKKIIYYAAAFMGGFLVSKLSGSSNISHVSKIENTDSPIKSFSTKKKLITKKNVIQTASIKEKNPDSKCFTEEEALANAERRATISEAKRLKVLHRKVNQFDNKVLNYLKNQNQEIDQDFAKYYLELREQKNTELYELDQKNILAKRKHGDASGTVSILMDYSFHTELEKLNIHKKYHKLLSDEIGENAYKGLIKMFRQQRIDNFNENIDNPDYVQFWPELL